jgi:hypothetical protein
MPEVKIKSGVWLVRPTKTLFLNAGGPLQLTPKKIYKAFRTDYSMLNQPGKETIIIVKDDEKGLRWLPVAYNYAKNNFEFVEKLEDQRDWLSHFATVNEHIRIKEKLYFKI